MKHIIIIKYYSLILDMISQIVLFFDSGQDVETIRNSRIILSSKQTQLFHHLARSTWQLEQRVHRESKNRDTALSFIIIFNKYSPILKILYWNNLSEICNKTVIKNATAS